MEQNLPVAEINADITTDINPGSIRAEADKLFSQPQQDQNRVLIAKSGNAWMDEASTKPIPLMLFDCFFFEYEACVLFSDTNLGKSALANQIAVSVSTGVPIAGFRMTTGPKRVMYVDFEFGCKQFQGRNSNEYKNNFVFNENFIRVEINPNFVITGEMNYQQRIELEIEQLIVEHNIEVLIIDNLTYMQPEAEKGKEAWTLMNNFKRLKNQYNLSILAIAHTPKRDGTKPILADTLQGSKNTANFCDSIFAIGESSQDESIRYIKQIKVRETSKQFGKDMVCTCQLEKPDNQLQFKFLHYGTEAEHLKQLSDEAATDLQNNVLELHKQNYSLRQIADKLNVNHMKVSRILKRCNMV